MKNSQRPSNESLNASLTGKRTKILVKISNFFCLVASLCISSILFAQTALSAVPVAGGVPLLSSNPSAAAKIYLDFDGEPASTWQNYNVPATPAYSIDSDLSTFSDIELSNIRQIWARVAEIYSPFNVNVTTVNPGSFADKVALHVVIGGSASWTGSNVTAVADKYGFYTSASNVVYVFEDQFASTNLKNLSEKTARAVAQAFGLNSQFAWNDIISSGFNRGDGKIAPIMGLSDGQPRGLWWNGYFNKTPYGSSIQDDMAVISGVANGFGYRADEAGDDITSAVSLSSTRSGVIATVGDIDFYSFVTDGASVTLTGAVAPYGAMLDLKLQVFSITGNLVAIGDTASLGESLSLNLPAGTYYVAVSGHGWITCIDSAGLDQGKGADVGQYTLTLSGGSTVQPTVPTPPSGLTAIAASSSQINLSWSDNSNNETQFKIDRATNSSFTTGLTAVNVAADVTSYSITGLSPATTYYFRIRATNAVGDSYNSAVASATTQAATLNVNAPGTITLTGVSGAVRINWVDQSTNETGFVIQRSSNGGSTWSTLANVGTNVVSYDDSAITAGLTYNYRVAAYSGSTYSAYVSSTGSITPIPATPTGVSATTVSSSQIRVAWSDVSAETSYSIERSRDGVSWTTIASLVSGTVSFTDSGLSAATSYRYRVSAVGVSGKSPASSVSTATTAAATVTTTIPTAPSNLVVNHQSRKNLISWSDRSTNETGFVLQYSRDGKVWSTLATLSANTTSYTHGIKRNTIYYYRVAAYNSAGQSSWAM